MNHKNFYETTAEANMRLRGTVVCYDGKPYHVHLVSDHKGDGIFRIYLEETGKEYEERVANVVTSPPCPLYTMNSDSPETGKALDVWMETNPGFGVIRKMMNSPLFNKFRPFPLGMVNFDGLVSYAERHPLRKTEQGLIMQGIVDNPVSVLKSSRSPMRHDPGSQYFRDTIIGAYPTAKECLKELLDPLVMNDGVAFHREFAFIRGPLRSIYLAYRTEVVGVLPHNDFTVCQLGPDHGHLQEVVKELRLFSAVYK